MGRHRKEGDSPALTVSAPLAGRHRAPTSRRLPSFRLPRLPRLPHLTLTTLFRRSSRAPEFPEPEGVTDEWIDTLGKINKDLWLSGPPTAPIPVITTLPTPSPVYAPFPYPSVADTALELPPPVLDPPTHYRRLTALGRASTRIVSLRGEVLTGRLDQIPGV